MIMPLISQYSYFKYWFNWQHLVQLGRHHQPAHEHIGEEQDEDDIASAFDQIANDNAGYIHQLNAMQSIAHQKIPDIIQPVGSAPGFKGKLFILFEQECCQITTAFLANNT